LGIEVKNRGKILLLCALAAMSLCGCGGKKNASSQGLIYWSSNNTEEIQFAKEIVGGWNKNNPSEKIVSQPVPEGQSSEEIILAAVVGKTTPDIYSNMWQGDVESYAEAGVLVALDTLPGFKEFIYGRCDSAVVEEITSLDGHIYQIPWKINPIMLLYNTGSINEMGLANPPRTYSEFYEASRRFQKDADHDGYIDHWFGYSEVLVTWWQRFFDFYPLYLAASNGGSLVKGNKVAFNNKAAVDVFRFLQGLYKHNYFAKESFQGRQDAFLSSNIASRFTGPWEISHTEKFKPQGFMYDFSTIPVPDGHSGPVYTYGDPKNIVIFKTCKNPLLAWRFLQYMIGREGDLKLLNITNQLPRRKNIDGDKLFENYFNANPKMKTFARQARFVKGTDASPVLKEVFDLISQEYEACVIFGKKTPEQAVSDAAQAVSLLFLK
jgi:multiple sugar transport system substrate-binding protein